MAPTELELRGSSRSLSSVTLCASPDGDGSKQLDDCLAELQQLKKAHAQLAAHVARLEARLDQASDVSSPRPPASFRFVGSPSLPPPATELRPDGRAPARPRRWSCHASGPGTSPAAQADSTPARRAEPLPQMLRLQAPLKALATSTCASPLARRGAPQPSERELQARLSQLAGDPEGGLAALVAQLVAQPDASTAMFLLYTLRHPSPFRSVLCPLVHRSARRLAVLEHGSALVQRVLALGPSNVAADALAAELLSEPDELQRLACDPNATHVVLKLVDCASAPARGALVARLLDSLQPESLLGSSALCFLWQNLFQGAAEWSVSAGAGPDLLLRAHGRLAHRWHQLAMDEYASLVVQSAIEHSSELHIRREMVAEFLLYLAPLAQNHWGLLTLEHLVAHGRPHELLVLQNRVLEMAPVLHRDPVSVRFFDSVLSLGGRQYGSLWMPGSLGKR